MKKSIVIACFLWLVQSFIAGQIFAQTNTDKNDSLSKPDTTNSVFKAGDEMPLFLEGDELEFIRTHLVFPQKELKKGTEGQVEVSLVIFKDGITGPIKVVSSSNKAFAKAGRKVIAQMKKWKPAKVNGAAVDVVKTFTILFTLPKTTPKSDK